MAKQGEAQAALQAQPVDQPARPQARPAQRRTTKARTDKASTDKASTDKASTDKGSPRKATTAKVRSANGATKTAAADKAPAARVRPAPAPVEKPLELPRVEKIHVMRRQDRMRADASAEQAFEVLVEIWVQHHKRTPWLCQCGRPLSSCATAQTLAESSEFVAWHDDQIERYVAGRPTRLPADHPATADAKWLTTWRLEQSRPRSARRR